MQLVPPAQWAQLVLQDQPVQLAHKAQLVMYQGQLVPQGQADRQDQWATLEPPEQQEKQDPQDHVVLQVLLAQPET